MVVKSRGGADSSMQLDAFGLFIFLGYLMHA